MRFDTINVQTVTGWVGRVLRFDFSAFDEIRDEQSATTPAILIVLAGSFIAGIGSWLWALQNDNLPGVDSGEALIKTFLMGGIIQTVVWFLWVWLVYQVLSRGYGHVIGLQELLRVMGLAFSPIVFSILVALDVLAVPFGVFSLALTFLTTNIAIQQSSGADLRETTMANVVGFISFVVVMGIFANVAEMAEFGGVAPGILFFSLDF